MFKKMSSGINTNTTIGMVLEAVTVVLRLQTCQHNTSSALSREYVAKVGVLRLTLIGWVCYVSRPDSIVDDRPSGSNPRIQCPPVRERESARARERKIEGERATLG